MQKYRFSTLSLITIIAVILINAINPTFVYADDGTTTDTLGEESVEVETPEEESQDAENDSDVSEESEATVSDDESGSDLTEGTAPDTEETVEADLTVAEVLEQAPAGTEVVVVNDEGDVEPLVTQEAAEIVAIVDPMWCPAGATTVTTACVNDTTVAGLLPLLAGKDEPGIIYFTLTYNSNDATFDGTNTDIDQLADDSLTLQGGWNGTTTLGSTINFLGPTTFNGVPLSVTNWSANVTLNDIIVNGATGTGIQVVTTGDINLDNVSSTLNTNSGAYLDSCQYGAITPGVCAGSGSVTVANGMFDDNNIGDGLYIDSGGSTSITGVDANGNGLDGAYIASGSDGGTDTVTVANSQFSNNGNATGLEIYQYANGTVDLINITGNGNNFGAIIDATAGTGVVTISGSQFSENDYTGLHVESTGNISLLNLIAGSTLTELGNGANGAYLISEGNINVSNSTFNDNVHFVFPQDPGLYAKADGNITLTNVTANNNVFGAGTVLESNGTGTVGVTGGTFNSNGTFGIQALTVDGDITANNVTASTNAVKGLYLTSSGLGNIFVNNNSLFVENGEYGIYAKSSQGNINLDDVTVTGNNVTDKGALLKAYNGGNIFVNNSTFEFNVTTGLVIVASNGVNLVDVTADNNGGNGVEVYTTQTYACRNPIAGVINVVANVDGGTFTTNGIYGLMVKPGPAGDLVFTNTQTFGGNGLGPSYLDRSNPEICPSKPPKSPGKPLKVVEVPFEGIDPVIQECESTAGTLLLLPDGTSVKVGCPYDGFSTLKGITEDGLPGDLATGLEFESGIDLGLTDENNNVVNNTAGNLTISFKIPEDVRGRGHSILFWDPLLNDGQGGWIQMPPFEFGTSFPLHPDDPEDDRVIVAGVQEKNGFLTLTVNFPGIFLMVAR